MGQKYQSPYDDLSDYDLIDDEKYAGLLQRLSTRISVFLFFALILTTVSTTWLALYSIQQLFTRNLEDKFSRQLNIISRDIDQWYGTLHRDLSKFIESPLFQEKLSALTAAAPGETDTAAVRSLVTFLEFVDDDYPEIKGFLILNRSHTVLVSTVPEAFIPGLRSSLASAWPAAGELFSPALPPFTGDSNLYQFYWRPYPLAGDGDSLFITALISLHNLQERVQHYTGSQGEGLVFLDPRGVVVSASNDLEMKDPEIERLRQGPGQPWGEYRNAGGRRMVFSSVTLPHLSRWHLGLVLPYTEAFRPILESRRRVFQVELLLLGCLLFAGYLMVTRLTRPIRRLSAAAKRIMDGQRGWVVPETSPGEIGFLEKTFNQMIAGLAKKEEMLVEVNAQLEKLSLTDPLTGLGNRRAFQNQYKLALHLAERATPPRRLGVLDPDLSKTNNDRSGHTAGDEALKKLGGLILGRIRQTDFATRYGGEEFIIILPDTPLDGAAALLEELRKSVEQTKFVVDTEKGAEVISMTLSTGVSIYRRDAEKLFNEADEALYQSKQNGRNRITVYTPPV
jgi:diguanylate cyclase (GGDEF)-like protein